MAIEITHDEMLYGANHIFTIDGEEVNSYEYLSDELSVIEDTCKHTEGLVTFKFSWMENGNRRWHESWMCDGQGRVAGIVFGKNWKLIQEKMHEAGISCRVVHFRPRGRRDTETVYEFSAGNLPEVVVPDGHVTGRGRPKTSRKKELRDIVIRKLSEAAGNAVDHPSHYNQGGIECIDALRESLGPAGFKGFCKGNAIKYLWRSGHKNDEKEDLNKASWYINKLVEVMEKEEEEDNEVSAHR